jgi:hypothetical protein
MPEGENLNHLGVVGGDVVKVVMDTTKVDSPHAREAGMRHRLAGGRQRADQLETSFDFLGESLRSLGPVVQPPLRGGPDLGGSRGETRIP